MSDTMPPTAEELEQQFNEAMALEAEGRNPYPGSTYVGGVKAALAWVLGETNDKPLEDET